jgi:hypothetical protein
MMGDEDETAALAELIANPPQWIIYRDLDAEAYLRIWPGSDPAKLRMRRIEEFIRTRYRVFDKASIGHGERQLLKRIEPVSRS